MTLTNAPTLITNTLTIRGPQKSDLAALTEWITNSDRMENLGGNGSESDAWGAMISGIGHWHWHGYGFFVLEETATGLPIGRVGILNHVDWPQPELAWHMFDGHEGKSLCFEAAIAVRAWAGSIGLPVLISMIAPENARSLALAKRLGAMEKSRMTFKDHETIVMRHLAHDSAAAQAQLAEVTP